MKHSEIRARLSEYLERDLPAEERSRIGVHLETCTDCDRELRELRATVSLLQRLPEPVLPTGITAAVMARIEQGEGRETLIHAIFRRVAQPRFAAPLAAGLAGLFFLFEAADSGLPMPPAGSSTLGIQADASALEALAAFAAETGSFENAWPRPQDGGLGRQAGVTSGFTPTAVYQRYVSQVRMEEAKRRAQIQLFARQLRGAGHPNSASLASHFESRPTITLADWQPR